MTLYDLRVYMVISREHALYLRSINFTTKERQLYGKRSRNSDYDYSRIDRTEGVIFSWHFPLQWHEGYGVSFQRNIDYLLTSLFLLTAKKITKLRISGLFWHYNDVLMSAMASQITSLTIVYSTVYSGADQRNHQSSASLAFVRGIHRGPVNSAFKGSVRRKMFPFDDVIMESHPRTRRFTSQRASQ